MLHKQKMYVQVTYRNQIFCSYNLDKRHGQFFWAHSQIFFLNNVGDTIFFNSVCKMSNSFGPKLDIVSDPYMKVSTLLLCSVVGKYFFSFCAMLFFIRKNIFACLFSIHNTISLSCLSGLHFERYDGKSISRNVAHLNILVHDVINLLYYVIFYLKYFKCYSLIKLMLK